MAYQILTQFFLGVNSPKYGLDIRPQSSLCRPRFESIILSFFNLFKQNLVVTYIPGILLFNSCEKFLVKFPAKSARSAFNTRPTAITQLNVHRPIGLRAYDLQVIAMAAWLSG